MTIEVALRAVHLLWPNHALLPFKNRDWGLSVSSTASDIRVVFLASRMGFNSAMS